MASAYMPDALMHIGFHLGCGQSLPCPKYDGNHYAQHLHAHIRLVTLGRLQGFGITLCQFEASGAVVVMCRMCVILLVVALTTLHDYAH